MTAAVVLGGRFREPRPRRLGTGAQKTNVSASEDTSEEEAARFLGAVGVRDRVFETSEVIEAVRKRRAKAAWVDHRRSG